MAGRQRGFESWQHCCLHRNCCSAAVLPQENGPLCGLHTACLSKVPAAETERDLNRQSRAGDTCERADTATPPNSLHANHRRAPPQSVLDSCRCRLYGRPRVMFGCARSSKVEKALVLLVHSRGILHVIFRGCQSHFFMIASMWSREGVVLAADEAAHISHQ